MYTITGHQTIETRTVAQANSAIQAIIAVLTTIMTCIAEAKSPEHREKSINQLMGNGTCDKPDVEVESKTPKLVCAHKDCHSIGRNNGNALNLKFKQICHEDCRIEGVTVARHPEPKLINCQKFDLSGKCRVCHHDVKTHMHLPYSIIQKLSSAINEGKKLDKRAAEARYDEFVKMLNEEQGKILSNMSVMAKYCQANAIVAYNSSFKERVEVEIRTAQASRRMGTVEELQKMIKEYESVVTALDAFGQPDTTITTGDVAATLNKLFTLPVYGKTIHQLFTSHLPEPGELNYRDFIRLNVSYIP